MRGMNEIGPKGFERFLVERLGGHMGKLGDEVRRWLLKDDLECPVVQGARAQHLNRESALVDFFRVFQGVEDAGIWSASAGRHQSPEGVDKIFRYHAIAV